MAVEVASLVARLGLDKKGFDQGLKKSGVALGKFGSALSTGIVGAAGLAAGAIAGVGIAAFNFEKDLDNATAALAANLGTTKKEASELEDVMKDIFANNFGKNFDEIADAVGQVKRQLGDIDDKELQKITEGVFSVSRAFDKDFAEVLDASKVLMDEFGLTSTQALDFVSKGFQKGLDRSGDFTDSIREYGNLFGDAGSDASQFFSILETGAEGGVLGTDKIADAFKELTIRLNEGSHEVSEALVAALGEDQVKEMAQAVATGEAEWGDFFGQITSGLAGMENEWERNQAQIALFGTMAEDLGSDFTDDLSTVSTSLEDMQGATEATQEQFQTLGDSFEGIKRQALTALAPLGEIAGSKLAEFFAAIQPVIDDFVAKLNENLGPAIMVINDALRRIEDALGLTEGALDPVNIAVSVLKALLDATIIAIQATAVALTLIADGIEWVTAKIDEGIKGWEKFGGALEGIGDSVPDFLKPGSPTPFQVGIEGITKSLQRLNAQGGLIAAGGSSSGNLTLNMGGSSFNFANDANGQDQALMTVLRTLRTQLERS